MAQSARGPTDFQPRYQLGVLGAGNMAEAIVRGLLKAGALASDRIFAADPQAERRSLFETQLKIQTTQDNAAVARDCHTLLLSVKPQTMAAVLKALAPSLHAQTLIVSIAAGISTRFIEDQLGQQTPWRVIRSMPNTPMLLGEGMAAISPGRHATQADLHAARRLFEASARVMEVSEDKIDAVTALSGSGPAYFFYMVEQMTAAGLALGLEEATAHQLAVQTAVGAAAMMRTTNDPPRELRRRVTSPGGTTQAALEHLEHHQWGAILQSAIAAAERRAKELGQ